MIAAAFLAAQLATGSVAIPARDPQIEHIVYPIFQAKYLVERTIRPSPLMRRAMQALGTEACPSYLKAWRYAYREGFASVRAGYYSAVRKVIPQAELARPGLTFLDEKLLTSYDQALKAELKANGGEEAIRQLGKAMMLNLISQAEAAQRAGKSPMTDADVDALLQRPGGLCQIDPHWIEEDKNDHP